MAENSSIQKINSSLLEIKTNHLERNCRNSCRILLGTKTSFDRLNSFCIQNGKIPTTLADVSHANEFQTFNKRTKQAKLQFKERKWNSLSGAFQVEIFQKRSWNVRARSYSLFQILTKQISMNFYHFVGVSLRWSERKWNQMNFDDFQKHQICMSNFISWAEDAQSFYSLKVPKKVNEKNFHYALCSWLINFPFIAPRTSSTWLIRLICS